MTVGRPVSQSEVNLFWCPLPKNALGLGGLVRVLRGPLFRYEARIYWRPRRYVGLAIAMLGWTGLVLWYVHARSGWAIDPAQGTVLFCMFSLLWRAPLNFVAATGAVLSVVPERVSGQLEQLVLTPVDRRYVLLSANTLALVLGLAQSLALLALVAAFTRTWMVLPWGALLALCLHFATAPLYTLSSILAPYRAPLEILGRSGGNLGTFLAWLVGTPIPMALFLLPLVVWRPGQILTLPLAVAYGLGLYALTLRPLARLIDRRTHQISEAVLEEA